LIFSLFASSGVVWPIRDMGLKGSKNRRAQLAVRR
jgi:hypothetical protein